MAATQAEAKHAATLAALVESPYARIVQTRGQVWLLTRGEVALIRAALGRFA